MTTAYWDPTARVLYTDSRSMSDTSSGHVHYTKIRDTSNKMILLNPNDHIKFDSGNVIAFAGAGDVRTIEFLITMLIRHGLNIHSRISEIPNFKRLLKPAIKASVLVFTSERVYRFTFTKGILREYSQSITDDHHLSIGSGAISALSLFRNFGVTSEVAVRYARLSDPSTGGAIDRYYLTEDSQFQRLTPIDACSPAEDFNVIRRAISDLPERVSTSSQIKYYGGNPLFDLEVQRQQLQKKKRSHRDISF